MLIPCGHRVLVETQDYDQHDPYFARAKALNIEIVKSSETRYQASVDKGVIIAVGQTAWADFGDTPWAKVGDTVIFSKNAGRAVEDPEQKDKHFVVMNDEDVLLVVRG